MIAPVEALSINPRAAFSSSTPEPQHLQRFLKKYPIADKKEQFPIITVNPEDWAIDLEDPKKSTVQCCQMCSIQEDMKRVTSPGWEDQAASFNPYEWKRKY